MNLFCKIKLINKVKLLKDVWTVGKKQKKPQNPDI